ncbi:thermonuclease family protein [Trichocoleus sp. FACHB-90]|uniref:thermonuclease family protein n=1 Tax=Cyanophyceae TaxID=3028117 RepID=UPI00168422C3|nr:thermonuclease family protein [Trichocoleus sp. FACHB-90]
MTRTRTLFQNSLKLTGAAVLILSLVGCEAIFGPPTYPVNNVSDGDTINVKDDGGKNISVRFACVDAPEIPHTNKEKQSKKTADKNQFQWGFKAQQRLQELVKQGGDRVRLTITDTDQYGRKVSEVRLPDGTFVQEVLVKEGLVLVYREYIKDCPSAAIVEQAEAEAKKARRGVWRDTKFVEPWDWRSASK